MIILYRKQSSLQHFTSFLWIVDHRWKKNQRAIRSPCLFFPPLFFHLHCSFTPLLSIYDCHKWIVLSRHQINLPFSLTHDICFVLEVFEKKQMGNWPSPRCEVFGNPLVLSHSHPLLLISLLLIRPYQMKQRSIIAPSWMTAITKAVKWIYSWRFWRMEI